MKLIRILLPLLIVLVFASSAMAIPATCGTTGLLSQPTAQTLNSGNICVGVWGDRSEWGQASGNETDAMIVPFAITLGLGTFMEAYGSYPNLLFNDEEEASRRGYAIMGTKLRLLGKRSSLVKLSADVQFKRTIANTPEKDGLTDTLLRGIVSVKTARFGLHGWGGTLDLEDNQAAGIGPFEDVTGFGGGIEFFPTARLRLIAEAEGFSKYVANEDDRGEWMVGFQYFLSPHLTFSLGYGQSLSSQDAVNPVSPESRILIGFSSCQGIGTYSQIEEKERALPPKPLVEDKKEEPVKMLKVKMLSPLLRKTKPLAATPAVQPQLPVTDSVAEKVDIPPVAAIPVVALPELLEAAPATTAVEIPVDVYEEITIEPSQNVSNADRYAENLATRPVSPVGAPEMAGKQKIIVDKPTKARVYRRFLMPEFAFDVGQFSLTPEGSAALSMIAVELSRDDKWFAMRIDGHTDSTGSDAYNDELSYNRAVEYAMHLVGKNGVDSSRVFVEGFGERKPIASNETEEGRAQNRRVELLILLPGE